ncbi:CDP-glucose 4,6-dehydratase [Terrimonas sp. NA20]|uniref:CDP-glucose 4,6-dehydratase n=1 Tax=Terrimonas ginsenosidimutans TaxID=2908004 RepID=A0ABS9KST6_9BACT|nr:CDP-glucose 4,6-dehydratase [Terrimonas ginsenosidimutans]MCG2615402.1 CDP-glucose 4,6-dehydratase [Terrimonas ginsenosidimutans]
MEKLVMLELLRSYYAGKKVFLTGHTGFKGTWMMALLHQLGAEVKGYALAPEDSAPFHNLFSGLNVQSVIADIRNRKQLTEEIASFQPDYVFHLAAQPLVLLSYEIPSETFEVNVVGTANVLEAARQLEKRCNIIVITTDKVYDNKEHHGLYKEEDRLGGYDPYSASKACTELVVDSFRNSFFNVKDILIHRKALASARAGNVIGGGDFSRNRIIPDAAKALLQGKEILVRNPGSVRPWQHVLEPVCGYLLLGTKMTDDPVSFSQAFNFGPQPEDHLTVKELVELAIKTWGSGKMEVSSNGAAMHEANLLKLDISKAAEQLSWKPQLSAPQAIEWSMDWYKTPVEQQAEFTFTQIDNYLRK